ncbi:Flp pilus assembly protein TadG [Sphingomonas sp. F9_3S_D5_B_2]
MIGRQLLQDTSGASALEFAMVLPLLIILLFGIIDGGRFAWEYNRAEKATQMGARFAIVTDPIASALKTETYVAGTVKAGDTIPATALGNLRCTSVSCTCETAPCPALTRDATAFTSLVGRLQKMDPNIQATNVQVDYRGSGLGFAGDPTGMAMSPLVTVSLKGMRFFPVTGFMLTSMAMPDFATTLTAEDGVGSDSN